MCALNADHEWPPICAASKECELALAHPPLRFGERTSGTRGTGIPLNVEAVDARSQLMGVLASWAALVASERGIDSPQRTPQALADFLRTHLVWLVAHSTAADFTHEVTALARSARRAARPNPVLRVELGPCVYPGCDSVMYSPVRAADAKLSKDVQCEAGHAWPPHQWLLLAHRLKQLEQSAQSESPVEHSGKQENAA